MRVFKITAGVILIITGIFCFANPGATFLSIAFFIRMCNASFRGEWNIGIHMDQ